MKRCTSTSPQSARERILAAAGIVLALSLCFATRVRADDLSRARDQFARAVTMRTMLEGLLEKDRSITDYRKTIAAYHKVYLITPASEDCTSSFMAEGELYREMGRLYNAKYYDSAIRVYRFLLSQYPGSRFRGEALLAIADIQRDDLQNPKDAQATYKQYLRMFPHSEKAHEVLADLRDVMSPDTEQPVAQPAVSRTGDLPQLRGRHIAPRVSKGRSAAVMNLRTWSAGNSTRVMVGLSNTIRYTGARISSPDRIYFDLYKAQLSPKFWSKVPHLPDGLLNSVRVAQNRHGVVRIVLAVNGAKKYSAYLLGHPYRLVIEVHGHATTSAKGRGGPSASSARNAHPDAAATTASDLRKAEKRIAVERRSSRRHGAADPRGGLSAAAAPKPTRDGRRSLARVLDLKVRRIVIDPGHGGRDTGTIGPHGLEEKDVCLDIALRLGRLIQQRLPGVKVIYTRKTDVFIPLEKRTEIANRAHADLFISIHANSSPDPHARGVETYYLNFATSPEAMAVAARENATSQEAEHDLPELLKKIAQNDKIRESRELAQDIQQSLSHRLELVSRSEKNRGVKKAPFVVLIGANMPSVLVETSFLSNLKDEHLLREPRQRERIALGIYRGIATYLKSLNSLDVNKQRVASDRPSMAPLEAAATAVASTGNPK